MIVKQPELFPSVTDLISSILQLLKGVEFYVSLGATILRGLLGFIIALIFALLLSTIALHHDYWKAFLHPLLVTIRSIPVIALVLIALLWISPPGLPSFIAFFTMFPILYQSILSGLERTDNKLIEMAIVYRKTRLERFIHLYLPAAHTLIFSGMSTAMGFGWRAVIIGEVLAAPVHGIGTGMKRAQAFIDMRELLAWTVIAVLVSFIFDSLMRIPAKKVFKTKLKSKKEDTPKNRLKTDIKGFELSNLNKSFNDKPLIQELSVQFSNEALYLMKSASGAGKTTLMKIIAGICTHNSGIINIHKDYIISFSFQDLRLIPWMTVTENIAFALPCYPRLTKCQMTEIEKLIDLLELTDQENKLPEALSGGQQQRVTLARALIVPSDILLLDEPLTGLEQALKIKTIKTIENWTSSYKPVILWATHEEIENHLARAAYTLELERGK